MPGLEVKAVNDELVEVPTGEVGELIVKGGSVMQGYLNMRDATDEAIVNGWLKTGDFVTIDEDGFIFIVDRKKDLIIPKGKTFIRAKSKRRFTNSTPSKPQPSSV